MNKFTKGLALCGVVLMGGTLLTGCSLTGDQQKAIDLLTSRADDELVSVIDKQNKQLSKKEAVEMLELGRTRINYMWDVDSMAVSGFTVDGLNIDEIKIKERKGETYKLENIYTVNHADNSSLVYYGEENRIGKYNYEKGEVYWYNQVSNELEVYKEQTLDIRITDADVISMPFHSAVEEDNIYDIKQNNDGSYTFTIFTEKTFKNIDDKGTVEDTSDDTILHRLTNIEVNLMDGYIRNVNGYVVEYNLLNDLAKKKYDKDENGNYIIRYYDDVANDSVTYINANYTYNNEVNLNDLYKMYLEAEGVYAEYPNGNGIE